MTPTPFKIAVTQYDVDDLKARLSRVRWPNEPLCNEAWEWGTNLSYMKRLVAFWRDEFQWGRAEAELNRFPQFTVDLDAGGETHTVHFMYEKGSGVNANKEEATRWLKAAADQGHTGAQATLNPAPGRDDDFAVL